MLLALVLSQLAVGNPEGPIFSQPSLMNSLAFFEAFGTSGAGTTTACSTTAPTGAKGEALTFTRASSATCTKTATSGLSLTGIANGDLVPLTNDQCRVEFDPLGILGILIEAARTNACLRSQELENALWTVVGSGATPTVTANLAIAPDGTTTAERVIIPATSGAGFALVEQVLVAGASPHIGGCFVRGNGTSGTIDIASRSVGTCIADCAYVSTEWRRCLTPSCANANTTFDIGNYSLANGGVARGAADVFVWGCSREDGAYATSYIPTTSAAATRAAETASFTPSTAMNASTGSHAVTATLEWTNNVTASLVHFLRYDASGQPLYFSAIGSTLRTWDGTTEPQLATTFTANSATRIWSSYAGATQTLNNGGSTTTGAFDGTFGAGALSTLAVGVSGVDGIISRICADPSPTRCR